MKREYGTLLDDAKKLINGARQNEYGPPEDCFRRIAELWTGYLNLEYKEISSKDVAIMMILLKIAREKASHKYDNLLDIAGYAALAADLANLANLGDESARAASGAEFAKIAKHEN